MRYLLFIATTLSLLSSCEQRECCIQPEIDLTGRFVNVILDCDNEGSPEINCTEWLEFVNDSEVDILYGGSDNAYRFNYTIENAILQLEGPPSSSFNIRFEIVDDQTLLRTDTEDIWKKSVIN